MFSQFWNGYYSSLRACVFSEMKIMRNEHIRRTKIGMKTKHDRPVRCILETAQFSQIMSEGSHAGSTCMNSPRIFCLFSSLYTLLYSSALSTDSSSSRTIKQVQGRCSSQTILINSLLTLFMPSQSSFLMKVPRSFKFLIISE